MLTWLCCSGLLLQAGSSTANVKQGSHQVVWVSVCPSRAASHQCLIPPCQARLSDCCAELPAGCACMGLELSTESLALRCPAAGIYARCVWSSLSSVPSLLMPGGCVLLCLVVSPGFGSWLCDAPAGVYMLALLCLVVSGLGVPW